MEDRVNELALVEDDLVACLRHGGGDLVGVGHGTVPPVALGVRPGDPGLAAVVVGAQVRVRVVGGGALVQGVGAGGHRLGLQGLLLKGGGHLRRHHPPEVLVHVHLGNLAVAAQDAQGVAAVGQGDLLLGGGVRRLFLLHAPVDEEGQQEHRHHQ